MVRIVKVLSHRRLPGPSLPDGRPVALIRSLAAWTRAGVEPAATPRSRSYTGAAGSFRSDIRIHCLQYFVVRYRNHHERPPGAPPALPGDRIPDPGSERAVQNSETRRSGMTITPGQV